MSAPAPKTSDLLIETFNASIPWYTTPDGREVGTRPDWFDWPSVRLDEIGPPNQSVAERVRLTRPDHRPRRVA